MWMVGSFTAIFKNKKDDMMMVMILTSKNEPSVTGDTAVGSVLIDEAFEALIERRLQFIRDRLTTSPQSYAKRITLSQDFQTNKHKFGSVIIESLRRHTYPVPGLGV